MSKDHPERRMYRRSPGRQYGYEYDPLRSQNDSKSPRGETASRSGMLLAQRPDPRRTRQLMRQSIIASKRPIEDEAEQLEFDDHPYDGDEDLYEARPSRRPVERHEEPEPYLTPIRRRYRGIQPEERPSRRDLPPTSALYLPEDDEYGDDWRDMVDVDPDLGVDETLNERLRYDNDDDYQDDGEEPGRALALRQRLQPKLTRRLEPEESEHAYPEEDENYDYEYEFAEGQAAARPVKGKAKKKKKLSRRGLLMGAGAAVVAGAGIAAYEYAPKIPQSVGDVSSNVEHQVQDAFNKGVAQGMDQARKEFITSLDNLEGFTLEGAITAARLTRVAYDVFVSPIIKFGATITGDVLKGMLSAFKTARGLLAGIYQDNATLIAIQKVMESWVAQSNTLPKQLDAITQADLSGAQSYLRALQRKIDDEKAKVNQPAATPTPRPPATPK